MTTDPETQKKRAGLMSFLEQIFRSGKVKLSNEMPGEDSIIFVTAVEDFDPKSNDLWLIPMNKSYPRDEVCGGCGRQVVMSGAMYASYIAGQREAKIKCSKCVIPTNS